MGREFEVTDWLIVVNLRIKRYYFKSDVRKEKREGKEGF